MDARAGSRRKPRKSLWFQIAQSGALLAMFLSVAAEVDARGRGGGGGGFRGGGFGGGGFRGGGSTSIGRGGGFDRGSLDRGSSRERSGGTFSRDGNYSKPSALDNKPSALDGPGSGTNWDAMNRVPGSGGSAAQLPTTRPGSGGSGTQLPANRPGGGGSGTQLPADRPGGGGSGTEWRPDCPKCGDGGGGWIDHPIAAGVVIGAVAGARAAVLGASYYALPPDCPPYFWNDIHYYSCDGAFYEPQYEGDTIVYVTVPDPSGGQKPPAE